MSWVGVWFRGYKVMGTMVRWTVEKIQDRLLQNEKPNAKVTLKHQSPGIHSNLGLGFGLPEGCGMRGSSQFYLSLKGQSVPS
jgi:hypothetical protein